MNKINSIFYILALKIFRTIGLILAMGLSMSACSDASNWKEEVLLHDGSRILVTRSQSYGGRHEIGQSSPIKEQEITFILPGYQKSLNFKSEYGEDIGRSNFRLIALHILKDIPYIITVPNLCLSYNKWGRPNPPYVIFKHDEKDWKRVSIKDLPTEFRTINLLIETKNISKILSSPDFVPAELIRKLNDSLIQPEYEFIVREPIKNGLGVTSCVELVRREDGWFSPGGAKAPTIVVPDVSE